MENFQKNELLTKTSSDIETLRRVPLDYQVLLRDFQDVHFKKCLETKPEQVFSCMGLAISQLISEATDTEIPHKIHARLYNYEPITPISHLKSAFVGKLVCIRGTVVRVGSIKPIVTAMDFSCSRCSAQFHEYFVDGKFHYPERCKTAGCNSKIFDPLQSTAKTEDWQKIKVQEVMTGSDPGRVPRTVEVELTEDQVDSCVPGDVVTICGQVKLSGTQVSRGRVKGGQSIYVSYIDANCVGNIKQGDTGKLDLLQFSLKEINGIQKIVMAKNIFGLIVKSICPSIYGNQLVKAGLVLAMFSGAQKKASANSSLGIRGDIHVLLVGDPGLGKSQLLQAVCEIAPRGVYVCGSYSSTSGLTVTLLRDQSTGDYALEAGALVLGDQGICCIDEFDKMRHEHQALLEAMEQQSVSIAKAGIVCNLPARTAVIAAANPCGGHYNKAKTVAENLKISAPLLSRFDLVFILLDKPDEHRDLLLSEHVMSLHTTGGDRPSQRPSQRPTVAQAATQTTDTDDTSDLLARLMSTAAKPSPIHPQLLRKYIGYAKKYCPSPVLSDEAADVLQDFYISLREHQSSTDYTPITTRQIESMIRLAEARARLELRDLVTKQDAQDVVQIMRQSLKEAFEDDFECFDFRKTSAMSSAKQQKTFISILNQKSKKTMNCIFAFAELKTIAMEAHLNVPNLEDFIETLNFHGYLLKQGNGHYKLATT